jgi:DNA-binding NtrC family response regulator
MRALPPLRDRSEDIPLLVNHYREKFNQEMDKQISRVSPQSLVALEQYPFPGNIRELQNVMEHAFVCCEEQTIQFEHLPTDLQRHYLEHQEWAIERQAICRALDKTGWHFKEASQQLGIGRSTLWRKVRLFKIKPEA